MKEFTLHILETDEDVYEGNCISLVVPTIDGMYGIQAHHYNLFSALETGIMKYTTPDKTEHFLAISGGMIKVEGNDVLILADSVERPEEIDEERAHYEISEAGEYIKKSKDDNEYGDITMKNAEAMMRRAINRIKLKKRFGEFK